MNSSKIVLNTSASFSSLRIENPKKAGPMNEESENNLKLFVDNIPKINEIFNVECMVGEGTFSKVYKAKHILTQVDFALKCVVPTIKPSRIIPELRYLRDLGGDSNIIDIKTCLFEAGYTVIVMPYFQHDRFSDYIKEMDMDEIRNYMRNLLIALRKVHSIGVIHRDIKPNNFLYNRREKKFALVDFGLAQNEADILKASKTFNRSHLNFVKKSKSKNQESLKDNSKITANSLFRKDSKMVCVRKRLLTEYDDENVIPLKFKKTRHESPIKQFKSSIFNTPSTPLNKAMNNMTNFQSTPSVTPFCFNMTANFDVDSKVLYQEKFNPVFQSADMYKTPTKKNTSILGQIQNSPNSLIIPETPPKSAKSTIEPKRIFKTKLNSPTKVKKQNSVNSSSSNISVLNASCKCYSLEKICKICTKRAECMAPRAGTPGFRAPEVLLKQLCQTSAIDIWSCGVIFASLLTKKYPFFRNTDDLTSLAEIISIFGSERVNKAAQSIGKLITCSEKNVLPTDLKQTLTKLRGDQMRIDDSAFDLLDKLLDPNPYLRISASDALNHPFFSYY